MSAIDRVVHLVTNDARIDSRVRRHAAASREVAVRVSLVAVEPPSGTPAVPIEGVEIVRAGRGFTDSHLYGAGRWLARVARGAGGAPAGGGDRGGGGAETGRDAGRGAAAAASPVRARVGRGVARAKTLARDRLEARHLDRLGRGFERALERLAPDVVVCNDLDTLGAGVRFARRRRGVGVVFDAHELWPEHSSHRTRWWVTRWGRIERRLAPEATACVTVNDALAEVLSARWGGRAVGVVRNALPRELAPPRDVRARAGGDPLQVVYAGAYLDGRGLPELVDAVATLARGRARLVLYGFGPLQAALEARARAKGCAEHVRFEAPLPQPALMEALAHADVGVVPYQPVNLNSRLCTPTKLYEYLCAGVAIAASDLPAIRAIVEPSGAGVLFDPHDPASIAGALDALARDPARLDACRAAARAAFESRYNWETEREVYLGALTAGRS